MKKSEACVHLSVLALAGVAGAAVFRRRKPLVIPEDEQLLAAVDGSLGAYREHYHLDSVKVVRKSVSKASCGQFHLDFGVELEARLKYDRVGRLPHVQSIADSLGISGSAQTAEELTSAFAAEAVDRSLSRLVEKSPLMAAANEGDPQERRVVTTAASKAAGAGILDLVTELENLYIGRTSTISLPFRAVFSRDGVFQSVAAVACDGTTYDAALLAPSAADEMRANGIRQLQSIVDAAVMSVQQERLEGGGVQTQPRPVYHRVTARDYANAWTSNPAGGKKDVTKWRTEWNPSAVFPLYPANQADCANYVSQAIYAGGIPKTTTEVNDRDHWFAGRHGCSIAWENCTAMQYYFTKNGYWAASDYNCCNAGGVIFLKDQSGKRYHVIMCVHNDTVTRLFSAHTNDRLREAYTETSLLGKKCKLLEYWVFANSQAD